jgi:hypothetical protein
LGERIGSYQLGKGIAMLRRAASLSLWVNIEVIELGAVIAELKG